MGIGNRKDWWLYFTKIPSILDEFDEEEEDSEALNKEKSYEKNHYVYVKRTFLFSILENEIEHKNEGDIKLIQK